MSSIDRVTLRQERTRERIERLKKRMEDLVLEAARKTPVSGQTKRAAERAYRKYVCGRKLNLQPRFADEQRFFMNLFLVDLFTKQPSKAKRPVEAARTIGENYAFEWVNHDITRPARVQARDMILRSAESAFGDTPFDGPLAYVIFHHEMLGIRDLTSYGELYTRAVQLHQEGYFNDRTTVAD
jgi:hypothetical protein